MKIIDELISKLTGGVPVPSVKDSASFTLFPSARYFSASSRTPIPKYELTIDEEGQH